MAADVSVIETERLRLRCWRYADRDAFAAMNADPIVMEDLGGPIARGDSDDKYDYYLNRLDEFGFSRWAIETLSGVFIGYAGVIRRRGAHPLGDHDEIGWRLNRQAWGHGYATEAAATALGDVYRRIGLAEVFAYTAPDNHRSQAVIRRLNMRRDQARDFTVESDMGGQRRCLVWVASH